MERLWVLPIGQLAAEVMIRAFKPEYDHAAGIQELGGTVDYFVPEYGPMRMGDITPPEVVALQDLLAEAVQVLEHARLIRSKFGYSGQVACDGWATTRLGRSALASGTVQASVDQLLAQR